MRYFNSFESYALLLLQNENIRYTKYPISTQPAKENKSCMLRMQDMRNGRELCALP